MRFQLAKLRVTATAAMRLVEQGRLKLDAPGRDYLPTFRVQDDDASRRATLRTLLTHTGGWEGDLFDEMADFPPSAARRRALAHRRQEARRGHR
jgi:CubicO group peptidase (beta-lactamase class C family)